MPEDLKILLVDNNGPFLTYLSKVVAQTEGAKVVETASNGRIAIAKIMQHQVDLVLLEMDLPLMDGLETLGRLRKSHPTVGVVMMSGALTEKSERVVRALKMGALDFISKSGIEATETGALTLRRRLLPILGLLRARKSSSLTRNLLDERTVASETPSERHDPIQPSPVVDAPPTAPSLESGSPRVPVANPRLDMIAIGVSTGGPEALARLIPSLPGDLGIPLLLVQHMPANMTASLADNLNRKSALQVREAVHGEELLPDVVYLAPGGKHMLVVRERTARNPAGVRRIRLTVDPPVNSCRPSVDVLFQSIAETSDGSTLAVIMTGMGNDGMQGVRMLKRKGCYCLTQSEESCIVYGMPRAVVEAGLSDETLGLDRMAPRIVDLVRSPRLRVQ